MTESEMRTPNLFLIGAMKAGTTTLAAHLVRSPDIEYFAGKEPNIFNNDSLAKVRARLSEGGRGPLKSQWIIDATPNYTRFPEDRTPEYIKALTTEPPRFIYLIRDPVERVVSHYFWNRERYGESLAFSEAVTRDRRYIDPSLYDVQIERYFALFNPDLFHFVKFEAFIHRPEETVAQLLASLGAAPAESLDRGKQLASTNKKMTREARLPRLVTALRSNRSLVELAKFAIPAKHHVRLMRRLTRKVPREEIPQIEKQALRRREFMDSIKRSEALTGLDLSDWCR